MMQIVYTQKHNIYYLNRVEGRDDRLTKRGACEVTNRGI